MSLLHVKYLLIGGGVASSEAARAIRARDARGDLLLLGQEINRPYFRKPLSRQFLLGKLPRAELFTVSSDWCVEHDVQLRTGRRVAHIDVSRSTVQVDNGEEFSFDRLLIATGATPNALRMPGADLANLFYLRTISDAEALIHAADKARKEGRAHEKGRGRAAVIGGGTLGVEIASSLVDAGLSVDLILSRSHPWNRIVGEATGRCLALFLQNRGVHIHADAPAIRVEGDGRVQSVALADGTSVACDFAVAAVGVHANKDILRSSPIAAETAILVNDHCATSVPNIYAAGDCAAMKDDLFGKHRVPGPTDTAAATGQIAGANLAGADLRFDGLSEFDSQIFGLEIHGWGEAKLVYRRVIRGSPNADSPNFVEFGIAEDGRLAQIIAVGPCSSDRQLPELLRQRPKINGNEQRLGDPTVPLTEI